ncbi:hypothetical protein [Methanopyrus sp.]
MLAAILGLLAILSPAAAAGTLDVKDVDYPSGRRVFEVVGQVQDRRRVDGSAGT